MGHITWVIILKSFLAHSQIIETFKEADFKCAVSEIMIGAKKENFPVVEKLRDQLKRSLTEIFSFFEACSRNVHLTHQG